MAYLLGMIIYWPCGIDYVMARTRLIAASEMAIYSLWHDVSASGEHAMLPQFIRSIANGPRADAARAIYTPALTKCRLLQFALRPA